MKFYFIALCLLAFNYLSAQDEYYDEGPVRNRKVIEGGMNYFIPQGDFARKSDTKPLGVDFAFLYQINRSKFFLGFNYSSRRLDAETVREFEPSLDIQARTRNLNYSLIGRIYPQLYLSIFEFFGEGGVGLNQIKTISRDYDRISGEYFNQFTNLNTRAVLFYAGGGFHISLDESWFLTSKVQTFYGPSMDFYKRRTDNPNITFPLDAFEITSAAYQATTISLSLSFIF